MPIEQNPDPQEENPTLRNNDSTRHKTLFSNRNGSNHQPTPSKWKRCNTNHSRPWLLQSSNLYSMHNNHHQTRDSPTILVKHLPLVWPPIKGHLQQRPQIYLSVRESPHNETGNQLQHLYGVSPTNRWTLRKEKSMGGTIPSDSHICKPRRLDTVAGSSLGSPQQQEAHYHQTITQSDSLRVQTPINPEHITTLKQ